MGRTTTLFPFEAELTGVESRSLRASLNLERRHVVAYVNAMGLADRIERIVTLPMLTTWERSKGRGYPAPLVRGLSQLEEAVQRMSDALLAEAVAASGPMAGVLVLIRPWGARRVHQLLSSLYSFRPAELEALDEGGGDFFQVLADAAIVRALLAARAQGREARVVMDKIPEDQSAPEPMTAEIGPGMLEIGRTFRTGRQVTIDHVVKGQLKYRLDPPVTLQASTLYRLEMAPGGTPVFIRAEFDPAESVPTWRLMLPCTPNAWVTYTLTGNYPSHLSSHNSREVARDFAGKAGIRYGRVSPDGLWITDHPV